MSARTAAVVILVVPMLAVLASCGPGPKPQIVTRLEPAPGYDEVAARFNMRVERLARLWSRVTLTLKTQREGGGIDADHAEGHLQLELPDRTALSVTKLGEVYFYFGSDENGYWWIDLSDRDRRVALVGRHDEATPEIVEELGIGVHPRELLDLVGVTPLGPDRNAGVRWSDDGRELIVTCRGLWGSRRVWLHPETYAPRRVELVGPGGEVRAACEMSRYQSVPVRGDGRVPPKVATRYRVELPVSVATLAMQLYGMENRELSPRAFDLRALCKAYGVDEVIELVPTDSAGGVRGDGP